jgi:hypothetical protein
MITNQRRAGFSGWIGMATIGGLLALVGCGGGGGGTGTAGTTGSAGTSGSAGTTGTGGTTGSAGTSGSAGTTGTAGTSGTTGAGGTTTGTAGAGGTTGTAGAGGTTGTGGGTAGAGGSGGGAGGRGGSAGGGGNGGGAGGRGGSAGGGGGGGNGGGAGGTAGGGGATNCAGHAVSFNANTGSGNDAAMARVNVAFAGSADLPTGNANRTIEFWAYMLTSSWSGDTNTTFFYGTNNRVADGFGLDFGANMGTQGTIDPFTNAIFDNDNQPSGVQANVAQWVHFAMTWDGTTVRAFVNGVEKASKAAPSSSTQKTLMTGMTALTIGGYPPNFFNGQIDEFRIWNVARTAAQITSTMNKALVGNEANLTGYWKFDETTGTNAADSVTSAGHTPHPGTLMANTTANVPTWVVSTAPISCP